MMKTALIVVCVFCAVVSLGVMGSDDIYNSFELFFSKFEELALTLEDVADIPVTIQQASQVTSGFFSTLWDGFKSIFIDPIADLFGGGSDNLSKPPLG